MREHQYFVYIATNQRHTVLYTGVTNDLARRMQEHKTHAVPGFTDRYNVEKLVHYEATDYIPAAVQREKQIKGLLRGKKIALIDRMNPGWNDLSLTPMNGILRVAQDDTKLMSTASIDVLAAFTAQGVRPLALRMGGRRYEPLHVHLTHTVREGRKCWRVFSVTDGPPSSPEDGNHFTLAFDPEDCRWRMWERG